MISPCLDRIAEGVYRCRNLGLVIRSTKRRIVCCCHVPRILEIIPQPACPMGMVLTRLTPAGVDRLGRCRAAGCGLMHKVDGHTTCVALGGKKCGWLARWAACLNEETPFPNGAEDCPHWKREEPDSYP